jgi:hypothetical protein
MESLLTPLYEALSLKRSAGSPEESDFAAWLVKRYIDNLQKVDEAGNLHFQVGESKTLFVAHIDTCHRSHGINTFRLEDNIIYAGQECLGADDGAGASLLCHLMTNGIPGYYIFTRQEECGGIGAGHLAITFPSLLRRFDRSICFDRRGTSEIITVQSMERCASSEFADALSDAFAEQDMLYMESENGTYTDNKEFSHLIAENVNISVGYENEHGAKELLDLNHLLALGAAVLAIKWEDLPVARKPEVMSYSSKRGGSIWGDGFDKNDFLRRDYDNDLDFAIDEWYAGHPGELKTLIAGRMVDHHGGNLMQYYAKIDMKKVTESMFTNLETGDEEAALDLIIEAMGATVQ